MIPAMSRGKVYLIGAGPGDPGLIAARGLDCLSRADVVVYDHLVHERLLAAAPAGAERIDVGTAAPQTMAQEAISYLLVEKAREGRVVARLKWGDPFVFDRGGEEALFLHEHGVPFEVVPGIPAAIGIPAYGGVPVTYPGAGDTLTLVRGHEDESQTPPQVDWGALAKLKGTIVCYAGTRQLPAILEALLSHGRPKSDSAAVIYEGTLPGQETVEGTLEELAERTKSSRPKRPAILVVGRVAALRQHLRWFDERPLFGRRVAVTRPREDAADLADRLAALGAEPIVAPMIRMTPPEDWGPLDTAIDHVSTFNWIVFTSVNAVDQFMQRLYRGQRDVRELKGVKICAIGPSARERLLRYGIHPDLIPGDFKAEGVVEALSAEGPIRKTRFLLPRADVGRERLAEALRAAGAEVTDVVAYRALPADPLPGRDPDLYHLLLERQVDVVTFTSAASVMNFAATFGVEQAADLLQQTTVAVCGPVTAEAAGRLGIPVSIMPAEYTLDALVESIAQHYRASTIGG
jgi:uroporphyrinogen III methyltransferase/synthase